MEFKQLDIRGRSDILNIVDSFYAKVRNDSKLRDHFSHVNWEAHLPKMYNFWENVVFHSGNYTGNPMASHQLLNLTKPISSVHFEQWLILFIETIQELYIGPNAILLIGKAKSIAAIMEMKVLKDN